MYSFKFMWVPCIVDQDMLYILVQPSLHYMHDIFLLNPACNIKAPSSGKLNVFMLHMQVVMPPPHSTEYSLAIHSNMPMYGDATISRNFHAPSS
jgi:hypothetical protein